MKINWTTQKPVLDHECVLLLCDSDLFVTAYNVRQEQADPPEDWQPKTIEDIKTVFYYWGILDDYGDEAEAYEDIESEYYAIVELPEKI
jgi:hypothetical protein